MNIRALIITTVACSFVCFAFAAEPSSFYAETKRLELFQQILANPVQALQVINQKKSDFKSNCKKLSNNLPGSDLSVFNTLVPNFQEECPLFLLSECNCTAYDRATKPELRDGYEKQVVNACTIKIGANNY